MSFNWKLQILGSVVLAGVHILSSSGAWAQYITGSEFAQSRTAPTGKFRTRGVLQPEGFGLQPAPVQTRVPVTGPVSIPAVDPNSALGSALASCDNLIDGSETIDLPGARGDVRLDRCYRGRDHLVCSFGALATEAISLLEGYNRITEAKYPELGNLEAICRIPQSTLAADVEKATDFNARFKSLKLQYEARVNCAGSVQQSFRSVTLTDMTQAPDLLRSMIDTIEGDMKGVADTQMQVAGLAEKIEASEKAMITIQRVHRIMCARSQSIDAKNRAAR